MVSPCSGVAPAMSASHRSHPATPSSLIHTTEYGSLSMSRSAHVILVAPHSQAYRHSYRWQPSKCATVFHTCSCVSAAGGTAGRSGITGLARLKERHAVGVLQLDTSTR